MTKDYSIKEIHDLLEIHYPSAVFRYDKGWWYWVLDGMPDSERFLTLIECVHRFFTQMLRVEE